MWLCVNNTVELLFLVQYYSIHLPINFLVITPGGAGEGHGEPVFAATLCGVDWADDGTLVGWGGPPNKSPRRSVAVAAEDGGWEEGHGQLISSPSRPRRSTSSGGSWAAGIGAEGSGFWGAELALLRWLERESISSSEGSLSSPWARLSGPPWGRLGSVGGWEWKRTTKKETTWDRAIQSGESSESEVKLGKLDTDKVMK